MSGESSIERFDSSAASTDANAFAAALDSTGRDGALALWPHGRGSGPAYERCSIAIDTYQRAFNTRLAEHRLIGGVVEAMMEAVAGRIGVGSGRGGGGGSVNVR